MKYQPPKNGKHYTHVYFRLPKELQAPFTELANNTGLGAQGLIEDMIKHCLRDMEELPVGAFIERRDRISG